MTLKLFNMRLMKGRLFMKESALNSRNSSIELLKIIAIVGIVVSHVVQTLLIPEGGG